MASPTASAPVEDALVAVRLQMEELQEQHDALMAEIIHIANCNGIRDVYDAQDIARLLPQLNLDEAIKGDFLQLQAQLAELHSTVLHLLKVEAGHSESVNQTARVCEASSYCGSESTAIRCLACLDTFPQHAMICAGHHIDNVNSATATAAASGGCGHFFCHGCLTEYVRSAVRARKFPIRCPMATSSSYNHGNSNSNSGERTSVDAGASASTSASQGCNQVLTREAVMAVLPGYAVHWQTYQQLEAEASLDQGAMVYCPHKACSSPLEVVGLRGAGVLPADAPVSCPACKRVFCPRCRITGWHQGYTCAQFQALPAHLRSAEDVAVLQLSARNQWRPCPSCKRMVERTQGCNRMTCICGGKFCYECGCSHMNGRDCRCE
ncbi:hypothetical protein VOLCADRAFT_107816 [Volvox carteri f. nagariensis]|uniref:RBR-type E3 ubiquitin transferase n=1 Tax=Volvox carteri f. nagariensis TaxID=3068 RepID=D8UGM8_VOLCA|nr:uncharacterized protein VOLCADRAFT_107816 [Volvox carteri f. nagariensis]EFJ41148.1 hypothetical protein VOLCADRAFT_107816 [Volvox carteri f. nagariensis]|eukprot:XP_002957820.1 hypothetical protein VOLCADRAFT_107816 [Volvox carteri f. nagariensis]